MYRNFDDQKGNSHFKNQSEILHGTLKKLYISDPNIEHAYVSQSVREQLRGIP